MTGVGKFQVYNVTCRERRWVAGVTEREMIRRRMLLMRGAVGGRREIEQPRKSSTISGAGRAKISCNDSAIV